MPNIADVMLNKRIDELASIAQTLRFYPGDPNEWSRTLEQRAEHLRALCLRGLARCYPAWSEGECSAALERSILFYEKPRTGPLGGGYVLVGSR